MATQVKRCSNMNLSNSPESSHESCDAVDTEMTSPLTSTDKDSSRSFTPDRMDPFHSAREREERIRRSVSNQTHTASQSMGPNPNSHSWRRQSFCDSVYTGPDGFTPLTMVRPGPTYPLPDQLNSAFAYGIRRPDGSYTRLLPADELPALNRIPRHQGPEGLIIVPEPHHRSPKPECAIPMIPNQVVAKLPPLPQPAFGLNQEVLLRRPGDKTQLAIDTIVASAVAPQMTVPALGHAMIAMGSPPTRREKVYCDKWVHEGTCAFTQVGCKFKHEMPMDKATQMSLGLPHGVPAWYRRVHGLSVSPTTVTHGQIEASGTTPTSVSRTSQSWRRKEASSFSLPTLTQGGFGVRDRGGPFGPIGPPHSRRLTNPSSGDSMHRIAQAENNLEEDRVFKMESDSRARSYTSGNVRGRN